MFEGIGADFLLVKRSIEFLDGWNFVKQIHAVSKVVLVCYTFWDEFDFFPVFYKLPQVSNILWDIDGLLEVKQAVLDWAEHLVESVVDINGSILAKMEGVVVDFSALHFIP